MSNVKLNKNVKKLHLFNMRIEILKTAVDMCRHNRCHCCPDYKHFCIAFRGSRILATGCNCKCRIPKRISGLTCSNHAETATIFKIKDDKPFNILVIRLNRDGTRMLISKPCSVCTSWISRYPVNNVFYSDGQGAIIVEQTHKRRRKHRSTPRPVIVISM